jgi:glycosyltransferase involved in cell wall biosynthesis
VLIPCLNEEAAIQSVIESVLALGAPVLVIDDGSDDRTAEIVATLPVILLRHDQRRGKGEALRHGFREAMKLGYDAVLTMDGDGQHLAADIPRIVAAATVHPGHVVIGARLLDKEQQPKSRRRANAVADWGISWACAQLSACGAGTGRPASRELRVRGGDPDRRLAREETGCDFSTDCLALPRQFSSQPFETGTRRYPNHHLYDRSHRPLRQRRRQLSSFTPRAHPV